MANCKLTLFCKTSQIFNNLNPSRTLFSITSVGFRKIFNHKIKFMKREALLGMVKYVTFGSFWYFFIDNRIQEVILNKQE